LFEELPPFFNRHRHLNGGFYHGWSPWAEAFEGAEDLCGITGGPANSNNDAGENFPHMIFAPVSLLLD